MALVAASSSSSAQSLPKKYDVFISFRGEDTRSNFTSHLYDAFCRKHIRTYIDYQLPKGDDISPSLLQAIEDSYISVLVFSENYATSRWCLDELTHILHCKRVQGQIVVPVFYKVEPSHVRNQTGVYMQAFERYERDLKVDQQKMQVWKQALNEAANVAGHDSHTFRDESEMIQKIVKDILHKLNYKYPPAELKGLVGIDANYAEIELLLRDAKTIGKWGMGGIGKSTIAKTIFFKYSSHYEGSCFLENVREKSGNGLAELRHKFLSCVLKEDLFMDTSTNFLQSRLSRMKVFVVLDDVNSMEQLKYLIGEPHCFGLESKILITTRDKHVLSSKGVDVIYKVKGLELDHSYKLFNLNAFNIDRPIMGYEALTRRAVAYAKGIPLALKVLGSHLYGRSEVEWESALTQLEKNPHKDIQNVLRLSYDGLNHEEKRIFLDIACFLKGELKEFVINLLGSFGFNAAIGIRILHDKDLINVDDGWHIKMHDLIQEMGLQIVREESFDEPERRSRLWDSKEIYDVLDNDVGSTKVESIKLDVSEIRDIHLEADVFKKMPNLRYLKIYSSFYRGSSHVHLPKGLTFLPKKMRYLEWHGFPHKNLPPTFCSKELVYLYMPESRLQKLWNGVQDLVSLQEIDLSDSKLLQELPDLSKCLNLKKVQLFDCESLCNVNGLQDLVSLQEIDLSGSRLIQELPDLSKCLNLKVVYLHKCKSLRNVNGVQDLVSLQEINLSGSSLIQELPDLSKCKNLKKVIIFYCESLRNLNGLKDLVSLQEIDLSGSRLLQELPDLSKCLNLEEVQLLECESLCNVNGLQDLVSLQKIVLSGSKLLQELPDLSKYLNLKEVRLYGCESLRNLNGVQDLVSLLEIVHRGSRLLQELPDLSKCLNLKKVRLYGCESLRNLNGVQDLMSLQEKDFSSSRLIQELPVLSKCLNLKVVELYECESLRNVNGLQDLVSLQEMDLSGSRLLQELPDLSKCLNLKKVQLFDCESLCNVNGLQDLVSLQEIHLSGSRLLQELPDLSKCLNLEKVQLLECESLRNVNGLQDLVSLQEIDLSDSKLLQELPDLSKCLNLKVVRLCECESLRNVNGLQDLVSLQEMDLSGSRLLQELPVLSKCLNLKVVDLCECEDLHNVNGFQDLVSLQEIDLSGSRLIQELPDLSKCLNLKKVQLFDCESLCNVNGLQDLVSLQEIHLSGSKLLQELPDLSKYLNLKKVQLLECESLRNVNGLQDLVSLQEIDFIDSKLLLELPDLSKCLNLKVVRLCKCESLCNVNGLKDLVSLQEIDLSSSRLIQELPDLSKCLNLKKVQFVDCESLYNVNGLQDLVSLQEIDLSSSRLIQELPDLSKCLNLKKVRLLECKSLRNVNGLQDLVSLQEIDLSDSKLLQELPVLSKCVNLKEVRLYGCKSLCNVNGLQDLVSLQEIDLSGSRLIQELPDLSKCLNLKKVQLVDCECLCNMNGLQDLVSLLELDLSSIRLIQELPDLSKCLNLKVVRLCKCESLRNVNGLQDLVSLQEIDLSDSKLLQELPDLSKCLNLKIVQLFDCESLCNVNGLQDLVSLQEIVLSGSRLIQELPDLSKCLNLKVVRLHKCESLCNVNGLQDLVSLQVIDLRGSRLLQELPDLSKCLNLEIVQLLECERLCNVNGVQDLVSLQEIDLSGSRLLQELPDLSKCLNLKVVRLDKCESLRYVHSSILSLQSLVCLDLFGCETLESLKSEIHLKSLEHIVVTCCWKLKEFSLSSDELRYLSLNETGIEILHSFVGRSIKLEKLDLGGSRLVNLPNQLSCLTNLTSLKLSNCEFIDDSKLHVLFNGMLSLRDVYMDGCCNIIELPNNTKHLLGLQYLNLGNCRRLFSLPELPPSISLLEADDCESLEIVPTWRPLSGGSKYWSFMNCVQLNEQSLHNIMEAASCAIYSVRTENANSMVHDSWTRVPGSKVPKWFKYRAAQSSVLVELPQISDLVDFFYCAVIGFDSATLLEPNWVKCHCYLEGSVVEEAECLCLIVSNVKYDHVYIWNTGHNLRNQHLFANKKLCFKFSVDGFESSKVMIKECGVRPVYVSDHEKCVEQMEMESKKKRVADICVDNLLPPTKKLKNSGVSQLTP